MNLCLGISQQHALAAMKAYSTLGCINMGVVRNSSEVIIISLYLELISPHLKYYIWGHLVVLEGLDKLEQVSG